MKVSLFEISYKKKFSFSRYNFFFRCTCTVIVTVYVQFAKCALSDVNLFGTFCGH